MLRGSADNMARAFMVPLAIGALTACAGETPAPANVVASSCGHAHNDYEHPEPLTEALSRGFCSVEADVFLEGDELLVAHFQSQIEPDRTLQSLYLDPLRAHVAAHGVAYRPDTPLVLLIDVKSDATPTYARIHEVLSDYADILTTWEGEDTTAGAVTAIISGNRDREAMEAQPLRYAAMDGRLEDLGDGSSLIPLVSSSWSVIGWNGEGEIDASDRSALSDYVAQAHADGRRIRFWASPDVEPSWRLQREVGVDLINTDDLAGLESFLAQP